MIERPPRRTGSIDINIPNSEANFVVVEHDKHYVVSGPTLQQ